jgi:hypothetical protein
MRHIDIWPVEYPEMQADKGASPMNFKLNLDLLSERVQSKHEWNEILVSKYKKCENIR